MASSFSENTNQNFSDLFSVFTVTSPEQSQNSSFSSQNTSFRTPNHNESTLPFDDELPPPPEFLQNSDNESLPDQNSVHQTMFINQDPDLNAENANIIDFDADDGDCWPSSDTQGPSTTQYDTIDQIFMVNNAGPPPNDTFQQQSMAFDTFSGCNLGDSQTAHATPPGQNRQTDQTEASNASTPRANSTTIDPSAFQPDPAFNTSRIGDTLYAEQITQNNSQARLNTTRTPGGLSNIQETSQEGQPDPSAPGSDENTPVRRQTHRLPSRGLQNTSLLNPAMGQNQPQPNVAERGQLGTFSVHQPQDQAPATPPARNRTVHHPFDPPPHRNHTTHIPRSSTTTNINTRRTQNAPSPSLIDMSEQQGYHSPVRDQASRQHTQHRSSTSNRTHNTGSRSSNRNRPERPQEDAFRHFINTHNDTTRTIIQESATNARHCLQDFMEYSREQNDIQHRMFAQEAAETRALTLAQIQAFQASNDRTTQIADSIRNMSTHQQNNRTSSVAMSRQLQNIRTNPPPLCPRDANIIVFLRTKIEDHIANNYTTRAEMRFAIPLVFQNDPSRRREAQLLAEELLPPHPKTEADRLPCYRAIAKTINECRAPSQTKNTQITPLRKSESISCLFRRIRIVVEEEYYEMGVSSEVINAKSLEYFYNSNKAVVSKHLCATFYQICKTELPQTFRTKFPDTFTRTVVREFEIARGFAEETTATSLYINAVTPEIVASVDTPQNTQTTQNTTSTTQITPSTEVNHVTQNYTPKTNTPYQNPQNTQSQFQNGQKFEGECFACARTGHRSSECRYKTKCRKHLKQKNAQGRFVYKPAECPESKDCQLHPYRPYNKNQQNNTSYNNQNSNNYRTPGQINTFQSTQQMNTLQPSQRPENTIPAAQNLVEPSKIPAHQANFIAFTVNSDSAAFSHPESLKILIFSHKICFSIFFEAVGSSSGQLF